MPTCLSCTCASPHPAASGSRLLVSTQVSHTLQAMRTVLAGAGVLVAERSPGVLALITTDSRATLGALRGGLSAVEAAEVRVADVSDSGNDPLAAALVAPTLAQAQARVAHADLLPLFADEHRRFRSVYQPIVDLSLPGERPVVAYEALLRATGPDGPILPDVLFGAAEEAGWLHVLDRVGRTTALRGAAGWLGDQLLFINFVPTTIYRPEVCLRTTEVAAHQAGLRLDQLVFEVTESERVNDIGHLADVFSYYRERGCRVALDDLGAGYSSLNMLVRLQPDVVKLDKEIVQALPDPASVAVMQAIVEITHSYGGKVLAECVETTEQAEVAIQLGVDLGQGWLFGRPEERAGWDTDIPASRRHLGDPPPMVQSSASACAVTGNDPAVALPVPAGDATPTSARADLEALMARAFEACAGPISIADATSSDLPLVYVNQAFERATGYSADEVLGSNCRLLQCHDTDPATVGEIRTAVREGRDHVAVVRNRRKDGSLWWNELHLSPVTDETGRVTHFFGFQRDVTDRVEAEKEVVYLADHDSLTGLPNRRKLLGELEEVLADRDLDRWSAVLFIDLDGFKAVNDRLGHAGGDLALIAAGECLRDALRAQDFLARYSGDEFVAVLRDVPPDSATNVAQRAADAIVRSLATKLDVDGGPFPLGASVGVALHPLHGASPDQLLRAADLAMYEAKQAGRGQVRLAQLPPFVADAASSGPRRPFSGGRPNAWSEVAGVLAGQAVGGDGTEVAPRTVELGQSRLAGRRGSLPV
jgi:diguanylate cyclase (GGDEF)-like protein/PAS domain S-box-containing protein